MRTSDLRRRLTLQQRSSTLDAWGQQQLSYADILVNMPACIESLGSTEKLWAAQVQSEVSHKITVRYNAVFIDPKQVDAWRLVYVDGATTRYFNIRSATIVEERHRWVELLAVEGLNDGS